MRSSAGYEFDSVFLICEKAVFVTIINRSIERSVYRNMEYEVEQFERRPFVRY